MKNINLKLLLLINLLFYSCTCKDYNIDSKKVQSIKIKYLIENDSIEIYNKEKIHSISEKINNNCLLVFTKIKIDSNFEITFRTDNGVKKDSLVLITNGQYFDVYTNDSFFGNYKIKNDISEYLYNFITKTIIYNK
jgi:hypothetical protein